MEKKNLLIGLILFLVVTNVATILTVVLHIQKQNRETVSSGVSVPSGEISELPGTRGANFMAERLGLQPEQRDSFRQASWTYNSQARIINQELVDLRDQLLQEMDRKSPDPARLDALSEQIGINHKNLKRLSVEHYLALKSFCTDEQKQGLFELFRTILNEGENFTVPGGRGGQNRGNQRQGQRGRGPWWQNQKDSVFN